MWVCYHGDLHLLKIKKGTQILVVPTCTHQHLHHFCKTILKKYADVADTTLSSITQLNWTHFNCLHISCAILNGQLANYRYETLPGLGVNKQWFPLVVIWPMHLVHRLRSSNLAVWHMCIRSPSFRSSQTTRQSKRFTELQRKYWTFKGLTNLSKRLAITERQWPKHAFGRC